MRHRKSREVFYARLKLFYGKLIIERRISPSINWLFTSQFRLNTHDNDF